jgi:hypothetical protein
MWCASPKGNLVISHKLYIDMHIPVNHPGCIPSWLVLFFCRTLLGQAYWYLSKVGYFSTRVVDAIVFDSGFAASVISERG